MSVSIVRTAIILPKIATDRDIVVIKSSIEFTAILMQIFMFVSVKTLTKILNRYGRTITDLCAWKTMQYRFNDGLR